MERRHTVLLVEDEPQMAEELGELLESLGHAHLHAGNKEDAERLVDEGRFCYVLLDLQIKANADSIKAHVEAGQSLLELIRERYPRRNEEGKHRLQILVMSGHAKEHYYVVKALQEGADDFITKPVGESKPPFKDKIQDALRRSGREKHEACEAITREARASAGSAAAAPPPEPAGGAARLAITGAQEGKRLEVKVGDKAVLLTHASFLMLVTLVAGRLRTPEGWVHKNDLGARAEQGWKGISRLKEELAPHLPPKASIVENDKSGSYRLHQDLELSGVDTGRLESLGDARIGALAEEIGRLQRRPRQA